MSAQHEHITADELATLNAARTALQAVADRAHAATVRHEHDYAGAVFALADAAGDAIFDLMNWTDSYGGQRIDQDVLHNREPEPEFTGRDENLEDRPASVDAYFIPVVGDVENFQLPTDNTAVDVLQEKVGGHFTATQALSGDTIYVHDEGLLVGLPPNYRISAVSHAGERLVGDAVLVGKPDDGGYDTDVSPEGRLMAEALKAIGGAIVLGPNETQ